MVNSDRKPIDPIALTAHSLNQLCEEDFTELDVSVARLNITAN